MSAPPGSATYEYFLPRSAKMTFSAAPNGVLTWVGEKGVLTLSPAPSTSFNDNLTGDGTNSGCIVGTGATNGYATAAFGAALSQRIVVGIVMANVTFNNFDYGPNFAPSATHGWRYSTSRNSATITWGASSINFAPANDTALHRYIIDINGVSSAIYMDGISNATGNLGSDTAAGPFGISSDGTFGDASSGNISYGASVIMAASIGTIPSIAALDAWLRAPFGSGGQFDTATFASGGNFDTATFDTKNFAI
jgi:hypothetical protein